MTTDATQVTQADKQAADAFWMVHGPFAWGTTAILAEAFARHREATTATLTAQVEALRGALAEQVGECFDERCEMCLRHEALLASTSEGE